jgi:hypothetical protein
MPAIVAVVLFAIAGILSGSGTHVNSDWFAPVTLSYFGAAFLALHFCIGAPWPWARRS